MERKYDIYCVGFKRVFYPGTVAGDSAFEYESAECSKDILCCYIDNEYKTKFEIELETHYDWCGSGYCGATYGSMERYEVQEFGPLTHITKEHTPVKIEGAFYEQVQKTESNPIIFSIIIMKMTMRIATLMKKYTIMYFTMIRTEAIVTILWAVQELMKTFSKSFPEHLTGDLYGYFMESRLLASRHLHTF